ncbi:BTB/POZ domain-containing protein [Acanthamoeba castellanii medusavirus]|uniref:BTB/POZ domain-containing protein n=1 Tax=Acanthamoeba castellanii medusavirus J1 TaxID=3114988 RepID=A0A3T1CWU0_9VIRU|nr:BTB/POZ domain-containing protein [Acanthamoeba castellanii medusavirus]BBI30279.1 BTB/POZ domain-containing protein [Acanthamoeba castellanii medusavirus J1]
MPKVMRSSATNCSTTSPYRAFREQQRRRKTTYLQAMETLLENRLFADVVFDVAGEEVHAHRAILSARCETFRAMFTGGMVESGASAGPIPVADCAPRAFRALLHYLYTDAIAAKDITELMELLELADRYLLEGLRSECDARLARDPLDQDMVIDLLSFADQHNAFDLKKACIKAIMDKHRAFDLSSLGKDLVIEMFRASCDASKSVSPPTATSQAATTTYGFPSTPGVNTSIGYNAIHFTKPQPDNTLFGYPTPGTSPFRLTSS